MPEQQAPQQQMSEEQIKALQEKIKQMSPEELKEFQKKQCIFCQIISGKVPSKIIYADEHVLAILDVNPANPGHLLIMPKEHYSIMPQIPDEEIGHIFMITKALSNTTLRALEVQGSNIIVANGVAAGQRAQHFMVHLIPRKENDNIDFQIPQKKISEDDLKKISKLMSESLGSEIEKKDTVTPIMPITKEKTVIEAEFKDNKEEKKSKVRQKSQVIKNQDNKKKRSKTQVNAPEKNKIVDDEKKDTSGANLDDIAKVLGIK